MDNFKARERGLLVGRSTRWIERWSDERGAMTALRFDDRVTLILFGGILPDESATWLEPVLERMLEGESQLHFIDQGDLETPNAKIRNLYMSTLRKRFDNLHLVHMYMGNNPVLRMISSAANLVLGNIGMFHAKREDFDQALARVLR